MTSRDRYGIIDMTPMGTRGKWRDKIPRPTAILTVTAGSIMTPRREASICVRGSTIQRPAGSERRIQPVQG